MKAAVFLVGVVAVGLSACHKAPEEGPPAVGSAASPGATTPSPGEPAPTASAEPAPTASAGATASAAMPEPSCEQYVRHNVELLFSDLDEAGRASVFADAGDRISKCEARRKVVPKDVWLGCANCIMSSDPKEPTPVYLERCARPCDAFLSAAEEAGVE